ncbi:MAG: hypothetical protein ABIN89_27375, partial [Chitinophagaceae bacterium]
RSLISINIQRLKNVILVKQTRWRDGATFPSFFKEGMLDSDAQHGIQRGWLGGVQPIETCITGNIPQQPPPFSHVLRIVPERPLLKKGGEGSIIILNNYLP